LSLERLMAALEPSLSEPTHDLATCSRNVQLESEKQGSLVSEDLLCQVLL
jgi:hypothetical protein